MRHFHMQLRCVVRHLPRRRVQSCLPTSLEITCAVAWIGLRHGVLPQEGGSTTGLSAAWGVVASASSHLTSVRQFNRYLLLHKLNARRGGKLELLLLEELRHRRTYAGQACAANGGGRQRNLTSRLRFCAVAVSRTSSLAPLKPRSRSRSSLKMRFMFRAERR